MRTLEDLREACGPDRRVAIARELTKLHEELWRGTLADALAWTDAQPPRGELVLVLDGAPPPPPAGDEALRAAVRRRLDAGDSARDVMGGREFKLGNTLTVPARSPLILEISR